MTQRLEEICVKQAYFNPDLNQALEEKYLTPVQYIFDGQISAFTSSGNIENAFLLAAKNFEGMAFYLIKNGYVKKDQNLISKAFIEAVKGGNLRLVKYLEEINVELKAALELNVIDSDGNTLLHAAAKRGNLELVKYLVEKKDLDIKATTKTKQTVLHFAARSGNLKLVKYLVEEKDLDIRATTKTKQTVLNCAILSGNLELVKYLVEEKELDIMTINVFKQTNLHCAARSGNLELFKYLQEKKLNINALDALKLTTLHYAAMSGNLELVQYLVKAGLDRNALNLTEFSTLHFAVFSENLELVKYLMAESYIIDIQSDEDLTCQLLACLIKAIPMGNLELVEYFVKELEKKGVNLKDTFTNNKEPLQLAAKCGYSKIVEYFVDKGFSVFHEGTDKTPLFGPPKKGYISLPYQLLEYRDKEKCELELELTVRMRFPSPNLPQLSEKAALRLGKLNKDFETISFDRYEKLLEEKNKNLQKEIEESDTTTSIEKC